MPKSIRTWEPCSARPKNKNLLSFQMKFLNPTHILLKSILFCPLIVIHPANAEKKNDSEFQRIQTQTWKEVFTDECVGDWKKLWFLDGVKAKVTNSDEAMTIDTTNGYAVLWTKQSFEGEIGLL